MLIGGIPSSIPLPLNDCTIPPDIDGPVVIWITSDGQPLLNDIQNRATSQIIAGPTVAFIDTKPQLLGQLTRQDASNSNPNPSLVTTISTTTLSSLQVSSLISSSTQSSPSSTGSGLSPTLGVNDLSPSSAGRPSPTTLSPPGINNVIPSSTPIILTPA